MTTNLIWILYRSDSDAAYKETLKCKKIIEGYPLIFWGSDYRSLLR